MFYFFLELRRDRFGLSFCLFCTSNSRLILNSSFLLRLNIPIEEPLLSSLSLLFICEAFLSKIALTDWLGAVVTGSLQKEVTPLFIIRAAAGTAIPRLTSYVLVIAVSIPKIRLRISPLTSSLTQGFGHLPSKSQTISYSSLRRASRSSLPNLS